MRAEQPDVADDRPIGCEGTAGPVITLPSAPSDRAEYLATLCRVLTLVRTGRAQTRPELMHHAGLSRSVVTQRVRDLISLGLVVEGQVGASTGGRAPRTLGVAARAGRVLALAAGATGGMIAVADLAGTVLAKQEARFAIGDGPDVVLDVVEPIADGLLADVGGAVWGVGVGLPGPVEFATGRPISPPIMPGWDGYDVRGRLSARYGAPTWVDNDVNLMAIGEAAVGAARGLANVVLVKVGTGIGSGLISRGGIHRGAQGAAGDIGHVRVVESSDIACRCGNTGCLEALAGGAALARDATLAAQEGRSHVLAELLHQHGELDARSVAIAARRGDAVSAELLTTGGTRVGEVLASLVNFFNPELVVLGGGVADASTGYLAAVRTVVYRRSLPLATRELRIETSTLGALGGVIGAAHMVLDELFTPERVAGWVEDGLPATVPAPTTERIRR